MAENQGANTRFYQIVNIIGIIGVLIVNYLANALLLGGRNTGELSNLYPSLITPAGLTFSIWGVIYLWLIIYTVRQAKGLFNREKEAPAYVDRMRFWFAVSCLFNMAWLFAWHYQEIPLSLIIMLGILGSLLIIYRRLRAAEAPRSEKAWIWPAFSIYLGWITVATIVNVSVLLIDLEWSGWGLDPEAWTILMLAVSLLIGLLMLFRQGDLWYNLVLIWAYLGIVIKQTQAPGDHIPIAFAALGALIILLIADVIVVIRRKGVYRVG